MGGAGSRLEGGEREIRVLHPQFPTVWCCCFGVTAMGVFCWLFFALHNLVSFEFGLYLFWKYFYSSALLWALED